MTELRFQKCKRADDDEYEYEARLVGGSHLVQVYHGDNITFKRVGKDHKWGFNIVFEGVGAPGDISVPATTPGPDTEVTWPAPNNIGPWKYRVVFQYDKDQGQSVADLDPVIIINPKFHLLQILKYLVALVVGMILGVVGMRLLA